MRRSTVRNGLRCILAAMVLVIISAHYHDLAARLFFLDASGEIRFFQLGLFWASLTGGYGVITMAVGLVLPQGRNEAAVSLWPLIAVIAFAVMLFFWISYSSVYEPSPRRLRPGETITI